MVDEVLASRLKPQVPGVPSPQLLAPPYNGVSLVLSRQRGTRVEHSVRKVSDALLQLILPAKVHFLSFDLTVDAEALADIGCTVFANPRFFPEGTLVQARRPLKLSSVTSDGIAGGTHGAWIDLDIPTCDRVSGKWIRCPKAFVYSAGVTDTLIFGLPFFCAFHLIIDPVQGCLLPYECVTVSAPDMVHTGDREQLRQADCCGIAEGHQQCIKVDSELASLANEVQIASAVTQALTFANLLAVLCYGGVLGMLLCHSQETQQRTMTPKTRSIDKGIKPKPAGFCLCDVTRNCVQKCSEKGVRPHWHAPLLWENRDIYISFADTHKCPCSNACLFPENASDRVPQASAAGHYEPAAAHPEVDADDAWWDQFLDLPLSDAKGRLMQFQCDQGSLQVPQLTHHDIMQAQK